MNPPTWDNTPVTEAVAGILETLFPKKVVRRLPKEDKECVVLSYREDFEKLWNLDATGALSLIGWALSGDAEVPRTFVLVWDGMPPTEGTINVADYVLPLDWAFALSSTLLKECQNRGIDRSVTSESKGLPNVRILILDLESERHTGAFSYSALPAFGHAMPWIQVYHPIQSNRIELAALFSDSNDHYTISLLRSAIRGGSLGVEALIEDLRNPDRVLSLREAFRERDRSKDIEALTNLFASSLLSAGNRHHVGNLLAPLLLAEALPKTQKVLVKKAIMEEFPLRTALRKLAGVVGLEGEEPSPNSSLISSGQGIINEQRSYGDIFGKRTNIRFLLIDDQFPLGYNHLLASFLFGQSYHPELGSGNTTEWRVTIEELGELTCFSSADKILAILESLDAVQNWATPRFLDAGCDILMLDLRLWTDNRGKKRFLERVLRLCRRLGTDKISDHRFKRAFRRATADISESESGQSEVEGLALFPLLISHVDPSLPIILFSSTHQRAVVELISHRPNIISDFAKPIFSGYGEEESGYQRVLDLRSAITKAINQHETRIIWREIVKRAELVQTGDLKFELEGINISPNGATKPAEYTISQSSIIGLAQEYCEYILTGRFADSLLVIGNWSEDLLGGKPDNLPATTSEPEATMKVLKILSAHGVGATYEEVFVGSWSDPAFREAIDRMLRGIKDLLEPESKRIALSTVLNRRDVTLLDEKLNLAGFGLPEPLPSSPAALLGRFLDIDPDVRTLLSVSTNWASCLNKDAVHTIVSVTNGFRNARAHRCINPSDSLSVRYFAIWCWLWTLSGMFPANKMKLVSVGDEVGHQPHLQATDFIHLQRPFVQSSLFRGLRGVAALLSTLSALDRVTTAGWLKINDVGLKSALRHLINISVSAK
jgi:hypothetical protein